MKEKENYPYSEELMKPAGSINCNRNNPWIALKEMQSIRRAKNEVKNYIPPDGIKVEKITYRSFEASEIVCYIVKKQSEANHKAPCMIYYHGGGFMMPLQGMMLRNAAYFAEHTGLSIFLPEYRYVPKVPCRTVIEDCFFLVKQMKEHQEAYQIDMDKLTIYGDSAGAALAAGVTHLMRDNHMSPAAGQMLIYPALDCHYERYASMETYRYAVWPRKSNIYMWKLYLKGADSETIKLAAPLNMEGFSGLPPAYIEAQEMDVLCDEGIAYAKKLEKNGSLFELNIIEGSYHGFDFDHSSPLVRRVLEHRCEVIRKFISVKEGGDS